MPVDDPADFERALGRVREPVWLIRRGDGLALGRGGEASLASFEAQAEHAGNPPEGHPLLAWAPALHPEALGAATFRRDHRVRYAYIAGSMANGIGAPELVEAMGRAGMVGFFGAAGLAPAAIDDALHRISSRLGDLPWGTNLIHSPYEPDLEEAVAALYLRRGVRLVSASAYLRVTLPVVRYRVAGLDRDPSGAVRAPNRLIAKVSRVEVARQFLSPPPTALLRELTTRGEITAAQAAMAATLPLAQDLTVEADSGGHTDNRPAIALLPTMLALREQLDRQYGYAEPLRVGLAGGISTPWSVAAAFAMGAAYVLTGSVNQACREAGTSDLVRRMLAEAQQADVIMAPAADMFEMGVKLQVLKRGTLFAMRAQKLYDLYVAYDSIEAVPASEREVLERKIFRAPLEQIWRDTEAFWRERDPQQLERAGSDPKHRMALLFRWYLGMSSRWAIAGVEDRRADFQIWCGPAMGAFNEWVRGSFLEPWEARRVVPVAQNVLHGAAVLLRAQLLRSQGVELPDLRLQPREPAELEELLR